ncbi:hypothetical protein OUZ56_007355 [Daphnia magna]|uniref:Uncharacterized protein n=1 Tax=Daphnia magna TaxID=35525 RepID=A0ABR0A9Q8_9CRUS|nr:hypothetical protein OUZ56_007355 [Daphnia magna]
MNKYGDTTSVRDKFRFKLQEANARAAALIKLINEQSNFNITQESYGNGSFPWNETAEINFTSNYSLIDAWMMSKRWKEEGHFPSKTSFL